MSNLYSQFARLLPTQPSAKATVNSVASDGTAVVTLRGESVTVVVSVPDVSAGDSVQVQGGRIVAKLSALVASTYSVL